MDILDYLHWRADLTFEERPYNEVDALAFCELGYELFDEVADAKKGMTLNEIAEKFFELHTEDELKRRLSVSARSYEVLKAMQYTRRYGALKLTGYVNEIDHDQDLQFSALTLIHQNKWKAIIFRGTDDTITGWKEDFSMLYRKEVTAQRKAVQYLQAAVKEETFMSRLFPRTELYVAGHSKGGNLAMYACAHLNEEASGRIRRIDNFDGPGFRAEVWESAGMQRVLPRITTYLPTDSFFGRMFVQMGKSVIVSCQKKGLMQHNPFNWQVDVDVLKRAPMLEKSSDKAVEQLEALISEHTEQELEDIVESVFTLTKTLNVIQLADFTKVDASRVFKALKELSALDAKSRRVLIELAGLLWEFSI